MIKKIAISFLLLFLLIAPASADLFDEMNQYVLVYNQNADQVPGLLKSLLGNEEIHCFINQNDGNTLELKVVTKDAKIVEFKKIDAGMNDTEINTTVVVTTDENTVTDIINSQSPGEIFLDAYDSGAITIEAVGLVKKISLSIGKIALKIASILGLV